MVDISRMQEKLEWITRKWWFFVIFISMQFVFPPYASKGYMFPDEILDVVIQSIRGAVVFSYSPVFPVFKIIPIVLIVSIIIFGGKAARFFNIYVAAAYVIFALGQGIGITEKYGVVVSGVPLIMFLAVASFWIWEVCVFKNDFTPRKQAICKYWVAPLALLAFWYPLNAQTGMPDFNPVYLFTNCAGMAFCTMTPVYVALLTIYYPRVNIPTLRVTSLAGTIIGVNNMHLNFIVGPSTLWWNGVLHIPLLVISIYALVLSMKKIESNVAVKSA